MTARVTRPVIMVHGKRKAEVLRAHAPEFKKRYGATVDVIYSNAGARKETTDRFWSQFCVNRKNTENFVKALKRLGFKPVAKEYVD